VTVDGGADPADGVFAGWSASPRLQECTSRVLRLRLLGDPLLRHSSQVEAAMMQAMATILTSAGFTVEDANDEYRPPSATGGGGAHPGHAAHVVTPRRRTGHARLEGKRRRRGR
jgi:hypothetical protein